MSASALPLFRWFFCLWKTPGGEKQCAIQENTPRNVCRVDQRLALEGGINNCDITIQNVRRDGLFTDPFTVICGYSDTFLTGLNCSRS